MKYALVTGGSRGLGRAVCLKLAAQGLPVIINYQSNQAAAEAVKAEIEAAGGTAEPDDYIAYLVNNAGIRRDGMMFMMPTEDWKAVLSTSLDGFYYVTRRCLPAMLRRKHGGTDELQRSKGRSHWRDEGSGTRSSRSRRDGQRRCSRLHRDRHDERPAG